MKLEAGEVLCDKCNGGYAEKLQIKHQCDKCLGVGKLNWIENIVGKKPPQYTVVDSGNSSIEQWIVEEVSKEIARKIDEEILSSIKGGEKSIRDFGLTVGIDIGKPGGDDSAWVILKRK